MYTIEKNSQTITNEFSNVLLISLQKPNKIESDQGADFHISTFQNFLKIKKRHHFSRFTDKGPSILERVTKNSKNSI